jgi:DUF1680 family protein
VVYCVEEAAGQPPLAGIAVTKTTRVSAEPRPGLTVLRLEGAAAAPVTAIPYFAWNNHGLAPMAVWLPRAAP